MLTTLDPKLLKPPSPRAQMFLRRILWFSAGVGVGASPYLGAVNVPGFKPLLSSMPFQIRFELISLSSFLLGIVALAVEFYAGERVPRRLLSRIFGLGLVLLVAGFFLFVALRSIYTVSVPAGNAKVAVLIGSSHRTKTCPCGDPDEDPVGCIRKLSLDEASIARCWGARQVGTRGLFLAMSYLILTGGFGALVGALVLRDSDQKHRSKEKQSQKNGKRGSRKPVRGRER